MEKQNGKTTARVLKGKDLPKPGVITVEKKPGEISYRCPCDVCQVMEDVPFQPKADRPFHCRICRKIVQRGKASSTYTRRGPEIRYLTECDRCERTQETTFLPNRDRPFFCDHCMRDDRKQSQPEKPIKAGVRNIGSTENPRFLVPCDSCKERIELAFAPREGERFTCKVCFAEKRERAARKKERPETRVLFNIECAKCGKKETLGFVPTYPSDALCTECFPKKERS